MGYHVWSHYGVSYMGRHYGVSYGGVICGVMHAWGIMGMVHHMYVKWHVCYYVHVSLDMVGGVCMLMYVAVQCVSRCCVCATDITRAAFLPPQ